MDGKRDTRPMESNSLKDHDTQEGDEFDDPRLNKLWNKVCVVLSGNVERKKKMINGLELMLGPCPNSTV